MTTPARVVLVGDTKQLDAVSAGQPFHQLQEAGMRVAIMDEVQRQKNDNLKQAVLSSMRGDINDAFDRLKGSVHQVENISEAATKAYMSLKPELRAETRILTLTNDMRKEISATVREELKQRGDVGYHDTKIEGLSNRQLSQAELTEARNFAPGNSVLATATSKAFGLTKNTVYQIEAVDAKANTLTLRSEATGEQSTLPLSEQFNRREIGKSLVAYQAEQREVARGDQIRFRITDHNAGITNGQRGKITSTQDGLIKVETQDGQEHSLKPDSLAARGIDLDYAATTHAVQGESVDRVLVAMQSNERLVTQKSFYVEISRAREEAILLTDNPDRLAKTIERETGERVTALETWREDRQDQHRAAPDPDSRGKDEERHASPEQDKRDEREKDKDKADPLMSSVIDKDLAEKIREVEQYAERQLEKTREITR